MLRKSHRQPQFTLQVMCEDKVLFVWVDQQNASEKIFSCLQLYFVKNLTELGLEM
jgi:hypothetical protein